MTRTLFAVIAAVSLPAGCDNATDRPARRTVALASGGGPFRPHLRGRSRKVRCSNPTPGLGASPGVIAKGPFSAQVVIKADGVVALDKTIPLTAEKRSPPAHVLSIPPAPEVRACRLMRPTLSISGKSRTPWKASSRSSAPGMANSTSRATSRPRSPRAIASSTASITRSRPP